MKMYKRIFIFVALLSVCHNVAAQDVLPLDVALQETYMACKGIDSELSDLKKMAGINTAVTAVGTGLGIGAVATGIAKSKTDEILATKYQEMKDLSYAAPVYVETMETEDFLNALSSYLDNTNTIKNASGTLTINNDYQAEIDKLESKSKKLGNWRTGLLAGNTVTNIAGSVIAGNNKISKTLQEQIDDCKLSVKRLKDSVIQAKLNGEDVAEATQIQSVCSGFEYVDISKINKRAKGAMVSSAVGAGTGTVGTITSALANSNKVRNDNSLHGEHKEEKLNTASNVLATGSALASATATIFNATQIKAIKDVATVAKQCSEVLQ